MTAALFDAVRALITNSQPLTLAQAHSSHYHRSFMPSIPGISLHTNGAFRLSAISHQVGVQMRELVGVPIERSIQGGEDADLPVSIGGDYVLEEMDWTARQSCFLRLHSVPVNI